MIKRWEKEESKQKGKQDGKEENKALKKENKWWKQKIVRIIEFNEKFQREQQYLEEQNKGIGPKNFVPIMKLGAGSFG